MKEILEGKDWEHYIERKNPLYIFILSTLSHGPMMDKITGAGFRDAIFTYSNGSGIMYHSKKEQEKIQDYFIRLIKSHSPKLGEWYTRAIKKNEEADKLLVNYLKGKNEINKENYDLFYDHLIETFNYGTVIPYSVLAGINKLIEDKIPIKDYEKTLHRFEELRGESKYPLLLKSVLSDYFRKAGELLKLKDPSLVEYLTPEELGEVLEGKSKIKKEELENRKKGCLVTFDFKNNKFEFHYSFDNTLLTGSKKEVISEFKGKIAFKGLVKGKVSLVNSITDMQNFKEGNIVVSINTNPSLMPVLRKCSAIVTDEGGIMCHAAIVSRELKIPCITSTKIATHILKDGDLIEVDANKGTIKILFKK